MLASLLRLVTLWITLPALLKSATESPVMKKYHELGTAINVLPLNTMGALPTQNLQAGHFVGAEAISGERLASEYLGRRVACAHCPVACIHLGTLRLPYPKEPYFYKTSMIGYDHEPIFAVGSLLGNSDVSGLFQLLDEAEVQGLDVMSAGVTLAWATEALQRGLISTRETDDLSAGAVAGHRRGRTGSCPQRRASARHRQDVCGGHHLAQSRAADR